MRSIYKITLLSLSVFLRVTWDLKFKTIRTMRKVTTRDIAFPILFWDILIDKSKFMDKAESKWKPFKPFYVNGISYGGLIGTPDSFIKYIQGLLKQDSQLITNDYKNMLFTENYTASNKPTGMCLSWFKGQLNGKTFFTHAGGGGGYYCEIRIYPDPGLGSLVFFNRTGMSDQRFLDRIDKIYLSK